MAAAASSSSSSGLEITAREPSEGGSESSEDEGEDQVFFVGQRFDCEGHTGTVRFVGPVRVQLPGRSQEEESIWIGVEWDDIYRGKHDGSFNGVRYFSCQVTSPPVPRLARRIALYPEVTQ